jgi:hypothetical protein
VATVTAADYTVEYEISLEAYNWFLHTEYLPKDKDAGLSVGESLKKYLK